MLCSLTYLCTPNIGHTNTSQTNAKRHKGEETHENKTVEEFNSSLTSMNRSFRWKISKATEILNDTIEQLEQM